MRASIVILLTLFATACDPTLSPVIEPDAGVRRLDGSTPPDLGPVPCEPSGSCAGDAVCLCGFCRPRCGATYCACGSVCVRVGQVAECAWPHAE